MKYILPTLVFSLLAQLVTAAIGHISVSFIDVSRNNREVTAEVYYPSTGNGEMTNWANGNFATVIFGHGFVMDYDAYQNIWEALVPQDYIVVLCTNETGFAPSHENFAVDLSFLATELWSESLDFTSFFYSRLTGKIAVAGHSMGGGASVLAASGMDVFDAYIGLAPAETNPSAIAAGSNVSIPSLILSGSADAVTPPDDHHIPIYESISGECKMFVNLIEGSHCYFANSGSLCDIGEFFPGDMSAATQQEITHALMIYWLDMWLKDADLMDELLNYIENNNDIILNSECESISVNESKNSKNEFWPNPASDKIRINLTTENKDKIFLIQGEKKIEVDYSSPIEGQIEIDIKNLASGLYLITLQNLEETKFIGRLIIQN